MKGILLLLAFYGIGTMASKWLHIPLPGNLLGMLALTLALVTGIVKLEWVEKGSLLLLRHMMLFFVPILVGVTPFLQTIAENPLPLILAMVLGPALVMVASGKVIQWYLDRKREKTTTPSQAEAERRSLDA
ncbi:CidA/LrgA family protein [Brevibacillus borstelensis]|uniref:CidA/LrgA family protein n=1 Tax=Brevibacillus borstelensis TaxID=45462 RepID=UPI0030C0638E